jgi:hypothetical protein
MATLSSVATSRPGTMLPTPSRTTASIAGTRFASKAGSGRSQATGLAATLAGSRNVRTGTVHAFPDDTVIKPVENALDIAATKRRIGVLHYLGVLCFLKERKDLRGNSKMVERRISV